MSCRLVQRGIIASCLYKKPVTDSFTVRAVLFSRLSSSHFPLWKTLSPQKWARSSKPPPIPTPTPRNEGASASPTSVSYLSSDYLIYVVLFPFFVFGSNFIILAHFHCFFCVCTQQMLELRLRSALKFTWV